MPRFAGFIGPGYKLRSVNADCQNCIGWYPELYESGTGKDGEIGLLVPAPGLRVLCTFPSGPVRGAYRASDSSLYVVAGFNVYAVDQAWTYRVIGTIGTSSGPVGIADNGPEVMFVDGPAGYIYNVEDRTFARITDENFPGAANVTYLDGSFLVASPGTQRIYYSELLDGMTWPALNFFSAEATADGLIGIAQLHQQIWAIGSQNIEVFYDSGMSPSPYQRIQGAVINQGCSAAGSIAILDNTLFWLGDGQNGQGIVWKMVGYVPTRISNHAIETALQGYGDLSGAQSWVYQQEGHNFYCLRIPGAPTVWVYDMATNSWHERTWTNPQGQQEQHRAACHAFAFNTHVVGDRENGNLYALDQDACTDNGAPIRRVRTSPVVSADMLRLFFNFFQLDAEAGVGLDGMQQGDMPKIGLSWSNDSGHTWEPTRWISMGDIGAFKHRIIWRRLGAARNRVFRVEISDPVRATLLGAAIQFLPGGPC